MVQEQLNLSDPINLLLVEGPNDQHVLRAILQHKGIECAIQDSTSDKDLNKLSEQCIVIDRANKSKDGGGYEQLRKTLPQKLRGSQLQRVGIVVDANDNFQGRWDSLIQRLREVATMQPPVQLLPEGAVFDAELPDRDISVGIWLMPDNINLGALEHFIKEMLPADDTLWQRAEACVKNIPLEERPFYDASKSIPTNERNEMKAVVHTWLAWQKKPGIRLGEAVNAKYLDANTESAKKFVSWITRLYYDTSL